MQIFTCLFCHRPINFPEELVSFKKYRPDNVLQYEHWHKDCWNIVAQAEARKAFRNREPEWTSVPKPRND